MYRSKSDGAVRMKLDGVPNANARGCEETRRCIECDAKGDRTEILKGEGKRYSRCGYFYRSWFVMDPGKFVGL